MMKEIIQSQLALIEDLALAKVDLMTAIAKRNGLGEELEMMITMDNQIYRLAGEARQVLEKWE